MPHSRRMTQPLEDRVIEVVKHEDPTILKMVENYMHDEMIRLRPSPAKQERERIISHLETNGPNTALCRAVVTLLRSSEGIFPIEEKVSG